MTVEANLAGQVALLTALRGTDVVLKLNSAKDFSGCLCEVTVVQVSPATTTVPTVAPEDISVDTHRITITIKRASLASVDQCGLRIVLAEPPDVHGYRVKTPLLRGRLTLVD
jgi:hypothetical protein